MLCDFEITDLELVLRDHFIIGYGKNAVQNRLFEDKNSHLLIEIARTKPAKIPAMMYYVEDRVRCEKTI